MSIYASDPAAPGDAEFVPGELGHLVVGNRGRLLDARRTPVTITAVAPELGAFEVEIGAFEDTGARWALPLDDVGRFQFARDASGAAQETVAELERARARFARSLVIECDPAARQATLGRLSDERTAVQGWLAARSSIPDDVPELAGRREGDPRLFALLEEFMVARDLAELELRFSETFVSNPSSGEIVKGHAIVLAELGLCPYQGQIARDPDLFREPWSKTRRADHIIARLAFVQELWSGWGRETVTLYRGAAVEGPLRPRSPASFVSATFSGEVAAAHFEGGPRTQTAVLWRQQVAIARLFMTFLETRAMNDRFNEAEAVLVADPGNLAF